MIRIIKTKPPEKFIRHKKSGNKNFKPDFNNMPSECKKDLIRSLNKEHKGVCAYCNQKLKDNIKVEHHCEQSICNGESEYQDRRIDYSNLLLVCDGNQGSREQHCDSKKSEFSRSQGLPIDLNPLTQQHVDQIAYTKSGVIKSSNEQHNLELNKILNLNQRTLKSLRSKKIQNLLKLIDFEKNNFKKFKAVVEGELRSNIYLSNFPGVSAYYYKKYIKNKV